MKTVYFRSGLLAALGFFQLTVQAAGIFDIRIASEFSKVVDTNQTLTTLGSGYGWIEGPVWVPQQGGCLIFSDQTNKRMYKWSPTNGITVYRNPSNNANGNTLDLNERLITCETDTRRLVLTDTNGLISTLVDRYNSKTFNSPNDVVVKSDGTVWFTDPNYGLGQTQPGRYVYRFNPTNGNGTVTTVTTDFTNPNGLCFSPDESLLYIADSDNAKHHIRVFDVRPDNTLANGRLFVTLTNGVPDGIRCDMDGRLYSSSANGVHIFLPDGRLVGRIIITNTVANLCFGGADWKALFIVAQPNVFSLSLKVAGTPSMKKLRFSAAPGRLNLFWPAPSTGFQLENAVALGSGGMWVAASEAPAVSDGLNTVVVHTTNSAAFYRLSKPAQ